MTPGQVESARQRLDAGMPPQEVARNLEVSVPTLYCWLPAGGGKGERRDARANRPATAAVSPAPASAVAGK